MKPFAGRTALVSSFGAESAVLLDMVATVDPATPVIFLDTGKLFSETRAFREEMVELLRLGDVRVVRPRANTLAHYDPGGDLWSREPDLCCHINKVEPLKRFLPGVRAWINGRRRDQAMTRQSIPVVEAFQGGLCKVNPMASWSSRDTFYYMEQHGIPTHPLFEQGYASIGCAPCTRPVLAGDDERSGRWAGRNKTECGIHTFIEPKS